MIMEMDNNDEEIVAIRVSDKLTTNDCKEILPVLENTMEERGQIKLLWILERFQGLTISAALDGFKPWAGIEADSFKMAVVGEERWKKLMLKLTEPIINADIQFFQPENLADANKWLRRDSRSD